MKLPLTLEELKPYVERLPELYQKHERKPGRFCEAGCACALQIVSVELFGTRHEWSNLLASPLNDEGELEGFCEGFDGSTQYPGCAGGRFPEAYQLGLRAREIVGLPSFVE